MGKKFHLQRKWRPEIQAAFAPVAPLPPAHTFGVPCLSCLPTAVTAGFQANLYTEETHTLTGGVGAQKGGSEFWRCRGSPIPPGPCPLGKQTHH